MADSIRLGCISLGAGVQSTTMALMAAAGEIVPMPDCAIFADTQWEPRAVYEHLARLEKALPFPVLRVTKGSIRADIEAKSRGETRASIPWWIAGSDGRAAPGARQCTRDYKIAPIRRAIRERMAAAGVRSAELWIGISTDEAARMKPSGVDYLTHSWPLIDRGMSRFDCSRWLDAHGWTAPRSACIGCPYHNDAEWRALTPAEFADAVAVDAMIREPKNGMRGEQFAHRSLTPLATVDLRTDVERGQATLGAWGNECEGMCGV